MPIYGCSALGWRYDRLGWNFRVRRLRWGVEGVIGSILVGNRWIYDRKHDMNGVSMPFETARRLALFPTVGADERGSTELTACRHGR
jgi:hypothetical protein